MFALEYLKYKDEPLNSVLWSDDTSLHFMSSKKAKHTSKLIQNFLKDMKIKILERPFQNLLYCNFKTLEVYVLA